MNHIKLLASFAMMKWSRFIQSQISNLRVKDSIRQTTRYTQRVDNFEQKSISRSRHAEDLWKLDCHAMLFCKSPSGAHRKRFKRVACGVAIALVGALCLPSEASSGDIRQHRGIRELASIQLTDKQYHCHNSIIYRESRFNADAVNGSHYGYYQGKSRVLLGAPADYQFYWYWSYVSHRYGITKYDEPNYCNALHHLRVKGWQ
jgi:hypothetical protein